MPTRTRNPISNSRPLVRTREWRCGPLGARSERRFEPRLLTVLSWPERLFHALYHPIERLALVGRIEKRETVDQAPATAEHDLLIKNPAIPLAGEHEPVLTDRAIIDLMLAIRFAGEIALIACWRMPRVVDEAPNKQPRIPDLGDK